MLRRQTPQRWRQGYRLYHRRETTNAYGDTVVYYDMSNPDLVVEAEQGLSFQQVRTWLSNGRASGGASLGESGEEFSGSMQAVVYGPLEVTLYDRIQVGEECYEVKNIQRWNSYRLLILDRLT
jgi:hypothetical protein